MLKTAAEPPRAVNSNTAYQHSQLCSATNYGLHCHHLAGIGAFAVGACAATAELPCHVGFCVPAHT
jgi:hypothetical protein